MEIAFSTEISRRDVREQFVVSGALALGFAATAVWLWLLSPLATLFGAPACGYGLWRSVQPYWRLRRRYQTPDQLVLEGETLVYAVAGRPTLRLPLNGIRRIEFREGLCVAMHPRARWMVLDSEFPLSAFLKTSKARGADLFFPLFSASVQARLQEIVELEQPHRPRPFNNR